MNAYQTTLARLRASGNLRSLPADSMYAGNLTDLSGNDYLGLAARQDLTEAFFTQLDPRRTAMTSSASRLLAAGQEEYSLLEAALSDLYAGRACLLFNSGYHANTGMLSALASEPRTLILADKLVHASMIDGMVLSRAPFRRFAHNDFNHLERILTKEHDAFDRVIVAVESVYSMDGDRADIDTLIDLRRRYGNVMLYVDEAHAFGVCGPQGLGLVQASKAPDEIDVVIGTFGKAAASVGAFAATSAELREYALNRARSFIFSTAIPPVNCAWTRFVLMHMTQMDAERKHLHDLAFELHRRITEVAPALTASSPSHITPLIVGDAKATVLMSDHLRDDGFKVLPIRTPTVPPGTERLRISLNAALDMPMVSRFADALCDYISDCR